MTRSTCARIAPLSLAVALGILVACQSSQREADVDETASRSADTTAEATGVEPAAETGAPGEADPQGFVLGDVGFQTPESVLHDPAADVYLVSNINGDPMATDDNGFISRVSPEGQVVELKWIDGSNDAVTLHSPRGLAIRGDSLFVADNEGVRVFHRETGAPLGTLAVPGASFLNDLATGPDGTLYATDTGIGAGMKPTGTDALYRFGPDGKAVAVVKGANLGAPNGVAVDAQGPVIVTFGTGKIFRVGAEGGLTELAAPPQGQLDGVVLLAGGAGMIVTGWEGKAVYHITTTGEVHTIWQPIQSPADLGYDISRSRMLVPSFEGNFVEARTTH